VENKIMDDFNYKNIMNDFRTPEKLKEFFKAQEKNVSDPDFIRKPEYNFLKEVWCAFRFGLGYKKHVAQCWISVNKEQDSDTDFFLKTKEGLFPFQTTIADVPNRRMGDEYKTTLNGVSRPSTLGGRIERNKWISDAIKHKIAKNYSTSHKLNLLVYANFSYELNYQKVSDALQKYLGVFSSIWIITNNQICSVYTEPELGEIIYFQNINDED
jgi:hypothetical protein